MGKTTLALALLRAFRDRGLAPAAFKCGPDYLDPLFHREALGIPARNLDLFFVRPGRLRGLFRRGAAGAGAALLEGAMGYYDGAGGTDAASAWRVAAATASPAVLALVPGGACLSLAALVRGFLAFRTPSRIRGLILNRTSAARADRLAPLLERETGLKVYGHLPEMPAAALPGRHLGLVPPAEAGGTEEKIRRLAEQAEKSLDLAGLLELARSAPPLPGRLPRVRSVAGRRPRIGVARDAAFCFYYPENLELLEELGAELAFFSPLADPALPESLGGLYLGGGYPEMHARELGENRRLREEVGRAVRGGLPTLAECGGFLYLLEELEDGGGRVHPMAGALPGRGGRGEPGLKHFGYAVLEARTDGLLCPAGGRIRVHEFHHWDSDRPGGAFRVRKPGGGPARTAGTAGPGLYAGFPHLYFWSDPALAERFVRAAAERAGRNS
jgi:cobyrinic acid a,c-diamide synthase